MAAKTFKHHINLSQNALIAVKLDPQSSDPSTPVAGQVWFNTTDNVLKIYDGSSTVTLIGANTTNTLTNKTLDANDTGNSLSNVEVTDFAASAINSDLSASALSTEFATADAVKAYADSIVGGVATTTTSGIVELATDAETNDNTGDVVLTAANTKSFPRYAKVNVNGSVSTGTITLPIGAIAIDCFVIRYIGNGFDDHYRLEIEWYFTVETPYTSTIVTWNTVGTVAEDVADVDIVVGYVFL